MMSLEGKLALVTGATSGIGMATARAFVREGARVVATGRNESALQTLKSEIGCDIVPGDLTASGACENICSESVSALGGLTTLVNCAGVLQGGAFGAETTNLSNYEHNFNGNTKSVFEMMTHSIPHLKAAGADAG